MMDEKKQRRARLGPRFSGRSPHVIFRVPAELYERFREAAKNYESQSALLRLALEHELEE